MSDRRLLLVHAHPDDEAINNGATMARYASEGAAVTLVTCTRGEEGEILVPGLTHLPPHEQDGLGDHRETELAEAMAALGVSDFRFLGGAGRYRDSGMIGTPSNERPDCFWRADLREAADHLVAVIREVRPQVLVTYDEDGGYGHPDHIQAHRVAMYGASLAAAPSYRLDLGEPWDVRKIYWTAVSESSLRESMRRLRELGDETAFEGWDPDEEMPAFVVPDKLLTTKVDGSDFVEDKLAAMRAHATQISVDGPFFALSNNLGNEVWSTEFYRLVKGSPGETDSGGLESDLFAGVA
jgi:N-acetyl-1-D-myo-inositol-2-amino-2-deoxy-alpha-D-glucopyranoside deacetylase